MSKTVADVTAETTNEEIKSWYPSPSGALAVAALIRRRDLIRERIKMTTQKDTEELKACPFCGAKVIKHKKGERRFPEISKDLDGDFYILCYGCFGCSGSARTKKLAIAAWNKRAPQEREVENEKES